MSCHMSMVEILMTKIKISVPAHSCHLTASRVNIALSLIMEVAQGGEGSVFSVVHGGVQWPFKVR